MAPEIVTIVGKSNSGKTTLMVKIIQELTRRGVAVGSVKHAHDGFAMDKEGKDSWRHKNAGAASTLVISEEGAALIADDKRSYIEKMTAYLDNRDIILAEGFKKQPLPKIEVFRTDSVHEYPLCMEDEHLVAFVTDSDFRPDVPVFGLEDIQKIVDFIEDRFINRHAKD
jgi:molybdopterin-guanine dinucleotide biosynthesis protein B